MFSLSLLDVSALAWLALCWMAYAWMCDRSARGEEGLMKVVHAYRERWLRECVVRENRMVDAALVGNLMRSVSFFASTSILILGGLLTALGYAERAMEITAELPMAKRTSAGLWETKVLLLLGIFFYAFFKLSWSLRQYNVLSVMIGAAPAPGASQAEQEQFVLAGTRISSFAGDEFIRGMRAYYFGMAAVTWFIQPWLFIAVTTVVVAILYWREFRSSVLRSLRDTAPGRPPG
ncbi:MAG TPA: DUF599 domain-containing protein [Burkholderiales bacterium]|nr:DUF599 domain-containing protein [Burkholderiales bacterium]